MNCKECFSLQSQYMDGMLERSTAKKVHSHLQKCPDCQKRYAELEALVKTLHSLDDIPIPEGLCEEVIAAVKRGPKTEKRGFTIPRFLRSWQPYSVVAACMLLFTALYTGVNDPYYTTDDVYMYTNEEPSAKPIEIPVFHHEPAIFPMPQEKPDETPDATPILPTPSQNINAAVVQQPIVPTEESTDTDSASQDDFNPRIIASPTESAAPRTTENSSFMSRSTQNRDTDVTPQKETTPAVQRRQTPESTSKANTPAAPSSAQQMPKAIPDDFNATHSTAPQQNVDDKGANEKSAPKDDAPESDHIPLITRFIPSLDSLFGKKDAPDTRSETVPTEAPAPTAASQEHKPTEAPKPAPVSTPAPVSVPTYETVGSLLKRRVTFVVDDAAAEDVFYAAQSGGTAAVKNALHGAGIEFSVRESILEEYAPQYNALAGEANSLAQRIAQGETHLQSALSQKEAQMQALRDTCSTPSLTLSYQ